MFLFIFVATNCFKCNYFAKGLGHHWFKALCWSGLVKVQTYLRRFAILISAKRTTV